MIKASNIMITRKNSSREVSPQLPNDNPALLMVGIALPSQLMNELAAQDRYPGIQGHNHQWAIIRGIELASGCAMDLISVAAISDYPRHPLKFVPGGRWRHSVDANDVWLFFVNIFPFKQISRFLAMWVAITIWLLRHCQSRKRLIFLYSTQSPQFYALLLTTFILPACKIVIMTDPPSVDLPGENWILRAARKVDRCIQKSALKCVQGLVVLAEALATDFAPAVPYQVVEGICSEISADPFDYEEENSKSLIIFYAGTIKAEYGVSLLLESLSLLPDKAELWLFGRGPFEGEVSKWANSDPRVKFFGFRSNEEVLAAAKKATVLVNVRPSEGWFTRYSFPSKILEYLTVGRPVISTRLPTIPPEYEPYLIWIEKETPEGFAKALYSLLRMTPAEQNAFGKRGREFVRTHKSERVQGAKNWEFARRVANIEFCKIQ